MPTKRLSSAPKSRNLTEYPFPSIIPYCHRSLLLSASALIMMPFWPDGPFLNACVRLSIFGTFRRRYITSGDICGVQAIPRTRECIAKGCYCRDWIARAKAQRGVSEFGALDSWSSRGRCSRDPRGYISGGVALMYPYVFVAGPNKHDALLIIPCANGTRNSTGPLFVGRPLDSLESIHFQS